MKRLYWVFILFLSVLELFLGFRLYKVVHYPVISVVLPTYNRADTYLSRAIESVLN